MAWLWSIAGALIALTLFAVIISIAAHGVHGFIAPDPDEAAQGPDHPARLPRGDQP